MTSLRNAIEYGESLQEAVEILINSGYNESEVREASKFIGGGVINLQEIPAEEQLAMPEEKGMIAGFKKQKQMQQKTQQQAQQPPSPQLQQPPQPQQIPEPELLQSQLETQKLQQTQKPLQPFQQTIQQPTQTQSLQQLPAVQQSMKQEGNQIKQDISQPQDFNSSQPLSKQLSQIKNPKPNYTKEIILIIILLILIGALVASIIFRTKILEFFTGYLK